MCLALPGPDEKTCRQMGQQLLHQGGDKTSQDVIRGGWITWRYKQNQSHKRPWLLLSTPLPAHWKGERKARLISLFSRGVMKGG